MKIKVYRVVPKENPNDVSYLVDAPSKRIAKWCGANLFNNEYIDFLSAKDMVTERFRVNDKEEKNVKTRMPDNVETRKKLEKLPRIYYVGFWAHWGTRNEAFEKYDKDGHPLVWYFNDHNGTYAEWILTRLENTTTGAIACWGDEARKEKLEKIAEALENARERKFDNK